MNWTDSRFWPDMNWEELVETSAYHVNTIDSVRAPIRWKAERSDFTPVTGYSAGGMTKARDAAMEWMCALAADYHHPAISSF